jgi:hypothetical protein
LKVPPLKRIVESLYDQQAERQSLVLSHLCLSYEYAVAIASCLKLYSHRIETLSLVDLNLKDQQLALLLEGLQTEQVALLRELKICGKTMRVGSLTVQVLLSQYLTP